MGADFHTTLAGARPRPGAAGQPPAPGQAGDRPAPGQRRGGHRRPGRPGRWAAAAVAAALAALVVALTLIMTSSPAAGPRVTTVAALPYWSFRDGTSVVLAHRGAFTEASPWIYGLTAGGRIEPQYPPGDAGAISADIARLRAAGLRIVPTVANMTGGSWAYAPVARMLHDPVLMQRHISALVALASRPGYAGVDIDYEELRAADRQAFTTFITRLGAALHSRGKMLSVAVFAKTTDAGYAPRNAAQDYAAIGRAADQVRVMAYDYHWSTSGPGPIAPVSWVRSVLAYARSQIPARKIILGIPLYGYDWSGGHGANVTWQQATQLAARHHVPVRYDARSQSAWFAYTAGGIRHQVWFETPASSRAKMALAARAGTGGVFLWMYGHAAPATWGELSRFSDAARPAASTGGAP